MKRETIEKALCKSSSKYRGAWEIPSVRSKITAPKKPFTVPENCNYFGAILPEAPPFLGGMSKAAGLIWLRPYGHKLRGPFLKQNSAAWTGILLRNVSVHFSISHEQEDFRVQNAEEPSDDCSRCQKRISLGTSLVALDIVGSISSGRHDLRTVGHNGPKPPPLQQGDLISTAACPGSTRTHASK